jgi:hypothetical protein
MRTACLEYVALRHQANLFGRFFKNLHVLKDIVNPLGLPRIVLSSKRTKVSFLNVGGGHFVLWNNPGLYYP